MIFSKHTAYRLNYSTSKNGNEVEAAAVESRARRLLILHRATIAILYRPYVLGAADPPTPDPDQQWKRDAIRRGREAASSTNSLLEQLIELDAIKWLKPMM